MYLFPFPEPPGSHLCSVYFLLPRLMLCVTGLGRQWLSCSLMKPNPWVTVRSIGWMLCHESSYQDYIWGTKVLRATAPLCLVGKDKRELSAAVPVAPGRGSQVPVERTQLQTAVPPLGQASQVPAARPSSAKASCHGPTGLTQLFKVTSFSGTPETPPWGLTQLPCLLVLCQPRLSAQNWAASLHPSKPFLLSPILIKPPVFSCAVVCKNNTFSNVSYR